MEGSTPHSQGLPSGAIRQRHLTLGIFSPQETSRKPPGTAEVFNFMVESEIDLLLAILMWYAHLIIFGLIVLFLFNICISPVYK